MVSGEISLPKKTLSEKTEHFVIEAILNQEKYIDVLKKDLVSFAYMQRGLRKQDINLMEDKVAAHYMAV